MEKKLLFLVNPKAGRNKSRGPLFDAVSVSVSYTHLTLPTTSRV